MLHSLQEKFLGKKQEHQQNIEEAEKVKEAAKEASSMYATEASDAAKEASNKASEAIRAKGSELNKGMEQVSEQMKEKGDEGVLSMKKGMDRISEATHSLAEKAREWMHSAEHQAELSGAPLHQAGLSEQQMEGSERMKAASKRVDELTLQIEKGSDQLKESADQMKEKVMEQAKNIKEKLSETIHSTTSQTADIIGGGAGTSARVARAYQMPQEAAKPPVVDVTASGTITTNTEIQPKEDPAVKDIPPY